MIQPSNSIARIVSTTQSICSLPAIPTQTWASEVAQALTQLSPDLAVGVIVAQMDAASNSMTPISTGAHQATTISTQPQSDPLPDQKNDPNANKSSLSLYLLDKLERVRSLGTPLPQDAISRGIVAPLSALNTNWTTTPLGRIFTAQHLQCPTIAILPIARSKPGFVLIVLLASPAESSAFAAEADPSLTQTLAQLVPLLSFKSRIALEQVSNPKAWLTEREQEILSELILGNSVRVIAESLGRSAHTVHDHVKNLHKKLGASSRGELIAKALGHTTTPPDQITPASDPIVMLNQSSGATNMTELKPNAAHRQAHKQSNQQAHQQAHQQARSLHQPSRDTQD